EVMILDPHRLRAPTTARILEATDQLLLFGIDADDRSGLTDKALALSGDMTELLVTLRTTRFGDLFAVAAQGDAQLFQQAPHGIGADGQARIGQRPGDLTQPPVRARPAPSHGITRQGVAAQGAQLFQESRRFFSAPGRPPPECPRVALPRRAVPSCRVRRYQHPGSGALPAAYRRHDHI